MQHEVCSEVITGRAREGRGNKEMSVKGYEAAVLCDE